MLKVKSFCTVIQDTSSYTKFDETINEFIKIIESDGHKVIKIVPDPILCYSNTVYKSTTVIYNEIYKRKLLTEKSR